MHTVSPEELRAMNAQRERCIDELADARVDALLYACLVAIMAQGPGEHRRTEDAVTAQLAKAGQRPAVLSSAGALVEALAALGATRIALVTPYLRPLAEQVVAYLESEGFEVLDWAALEVGDNAEVGCIPGERVMKAARGLDHAGADALVISACVQMPSLDLIGPAEEEFGLPVLSAATAGAYTLLRHLGLPAVLPGAGLLLAAEQSARSSPPGAARAAGSPSTIAVMTSSSPRGAARRKAGTAPPPPQRNGGKPAGATTARRELVENEIYEHAIRLFAERGFAGTSLQDIADALGITRPALYYYVKSKDELLAKLAADVAGGSAAQITELAARPDLDAAGKLREIARLTVVRQATQPERFRLVIRSEAELPAELSAAYDASRRAVLETVTGVIEEGIRAGRFRPVDARVAALGVIGMCNWVAWWFRPGRDSADAVADQLADMAIGAVQQADHRTPGGEGPAAALKLLRQDLDYLERILDA